MDGPRLIHTNLDGGSLESGLDAVSLRKAWILRVREIPPTHVGDPGIVRVDPASRWWIDRFRRRRCVTRAGPKHKPCRRPIGCPSAVRRRGGVLRPPLCPVGEVVLPHRLAAGVHGGRGPLLNVSTGYARVRRLGAQDDSQSDNSR
jgi:hypothetical protein